MIDGPFRPQLGLLPGIGEARGQSDGLVVERGRFRLAAREDAVRPRQVLGGQGDQSAASCSRISASSLRKDPGMPDKS